MDDVAKKYPDLAEDCLKKEGNDFRKAMKKEALSATDKHTGNLTRGFRLGPIQNIKGIIMQDFMAEGKKNPHWHLIENGHELVTPYKRNGKKLKNGGKTIGFVPGRQIVPAVVKAWQPEHEKRLKNILSKLQEEVEK